MSKILINNTAGTVFINDTGVSIPTATQYTIPPQDYLLWAASSDVITAIGATDLIVNDGSYNLSISDGTDLIKGLFPSTVITVPGGVFTNNFNEVSSVASGVSTLVCSYTAATGDKLVSVNFGGTNIAAYDIQVNGSSVAKHYTHFGNLMGQQDFSGLALTNGQLVRVYVLHSRPFSGDFNARITIQGA